MLAKETLIIFSRCATPSPRRSARCSSWCHSRESRSIPLTAAVRIFRRCRARCQCPRQRRKQTRCSRDAHRRGETTRTG